MNRLGGGVAPGISGDYVVVLFRASTRDLGVVSFLEKGAIAVEGDTRDHVGMV